MKRGFLLFFVWIGVVVSGFAQVNVRSSSYNAMLQDLLTHSVREIGVDQIDENDSSIVFLDAREYREYKVSHIKNAIWVGYDDFRLKRIKELNKNQKIIVYCSVGYRSEKISERLIKAGFTDVYNLYGSLFEWVNQGRPVYDSDGQLTNRVHAFDQEWGKWLTRGEKVYR